MERKLNPPFRWTANALTKIEVCAVKVIDTEVGLRVELYSPAANGERHTQSIDVPFLPTTMHADCILLKDHESKMEQACKDAVALATTIANKRAEVVEARAAALEEQMKVCTRTAEKQKRDDAEHVETFKKANDALRHQSAAASAIMKVVTDVDHLDILFLHRPAFGHTLRTALQTYNEGNYPAFVTEEAHKAALAALAEKSTMALNTSVRNLVDKFRKVLQLCSMRLSAIAKMYKIDVMPLLAAIENLLTEYDGL